MFSVHRMTENETNDPAGEAARDQMDDIDRVSPADDDLSLVHAAQRAELEHAVAEQKDKLLRLAAEFDNFRKRAARDREHAEHHGQGVVIRGLLEALDDLARFAHVDAAATDVTAMIDGARMVEQKLLKTLSGHGLEVVSPLDHAFDPALHEAIATTPAASATEDHVVAQVYQVGYVFHGQLLRPARVVVKQWQG